MFFLFCFVFLKFILGFISNFLFSKFYFHFYFILFLGIFIKSKKKMELIKKMGIKSKIQIFKIFLGFSYSILAKTLFIFSLGFYCSSSNIITVIFLSSRSFIDSSSYSGMSSNLALNGIDLKLHIVGLCCKQRWTVCLTVHRRVDRITMVLGLLCVVDVNSPY